MATEKFENERDVTVDEWVTRLKDGVAKLERALKREDEAEERRGQENYDRISTLEEELAHMRRTCEAYDRLVEAVLDVDRGILTLAEVVHGLTTNGDV